MVEGRRKPGVVCHLGRIYIVGGMTSKRKDIATVDVFNPITEEWEKDNTPPLMTELCGTKILSIACKAFLDIWDLDNPEGLLS